MPPSGPASSSVNVALPGAPDRKRSSALGYAMVASSASSWGLWPLFLRHAESFGPIPSELEAVMSLAMLTLVSGLATVRDRVAGKKSLAAWLALVWLGISDALNVVFFFRAIQLTTVAVAVLSHYLTPVLVALGAPFLLRERVTRRTFVAVGIALFGLVLLLEPWRMAPDAALSGEVGGAGPSGAGHLLAGAAFGAASAVFYASNVLTTKRLSGAFSGSQLSFFHGLVAVPLVLAMVPKGAFYTLHPSAFGWLVAGALGPGAIAGLVFVWGLRRVPAAHASALTLLEPFVAVMVGIAAFGEVPTPIGLVGAVLVLIGAALVVVRRSERTPADAP